MHTRAAVVGLAVLACFLPADAMASGSIDVGPQQSSHITFHIAPTTKPYHYTVSWKVVNDNCSEDPVLFCYYRKRDSNNVWQELPGYDQSDMHTSRACELDAPTDVGDYRLISMNMTLTCKLRLTYSITMTRG